MIRDGISVVNININYLLALVWWVADLNMWGKNIDLNHSKSYILYGAIEESRLNFEDTRYGKGEMSNPKYFSHEKWNRWEDSINN